MPHREVTLQTLQRHLVEHLRHKAHVLVDEDVGAIAHRDSGRLLPTVLEGVQAEEGQLRDGLTRGPHPEYPAGILRALVIREEIVVEPAIAACHIAESTGALLPRRATGPRVSLPPPGGQRRVPRCPSESRWARYTGKMKARSKAAATALMIGP